MEPDEILAIVLDQARVALADWLDGVPFDLERPIGSGGYMFDEWATVRSFAEDIVDRIEAQLNVPEEVIELPNSYPPASIIDGTLGDLCTDLGVRVLRALQ